MKYDLHIHTTCSDGKETKLSLLKRANEKELDFISFVDHNYIEKNSTQFLNKNYEKLFNEKQKVDLIDGLEFDIYDQKDMHILGYDIKNKEPVIKKLEEIKKTNDLICQKILVNIYKHYNILYTKEEILDYFKVKYLSKRAIVDWMVLNNHAKDYKEAGKLYTGKKSPSYEKKLALSMSEAIKIIKDNDGLAVLAHPSKLKLLDNELDELIKKLKQIGLDGIESLNISKTTNSEYILYHELASKYDLLETSGTDFHNYERYKDIGVQNEISRKFVKTIWRRR